MVSTPELHYCDRCAEEVGHQMRQIPHRLVVSRCDRHGVSKRRSFREEFEEVYLRYNTLAKYIGKADKAIVESKDFKDVTNFKSDIFWWWGEKFLLNNGFDKSDVDSLVMIWSYAFLGMKVNHKPDKAYFGLMMRFLDQRFQGFSEWVWKKFYLSEVVGRKIPTEGISPSFDQFYEREIFRSDQNWEEQERYVRMRSVLPSRLGIVQEQRLEVAMSEFGPGDQGYVGVLQEQVVDLEEALESGRPAKEAKTLRYRRDYLVGKIKALKGPAPRSLETLREEFLKDPKKFSLDLCYYASTKLVSYDIRRKARELCRDNDIDYVAWATSQVKEHNVPASYFDVRISGEQ